MSPTWPCWYLDSVTRFGEISPLWQNLKCLGQILGVYLLLGKIFEQLWQIFYAIWQIFAHINDQILKNNLAIWSLCTYIFFCFLQIFCVFQCVYYELCRPQTNGKIFKAKNVVESFIVFVFV